MKFHHLCAAAAGTLLLAGCGGGEGSYGGPSAGDAQQAPGELRTGVFLDAPVEGLYFRSSSGEEGYTGAGGEFRYREGDSVRFGFGRKVYFGEVRPAPDGIVEPDAFGADMALVAQLLQSADTDLNASNGIRLPEGMGAVIDAATDGEEAISIAYARIFPILAPYVDRDGDGRPDVDAVDAVDAYNRAKIQFGRWVSEADPSRIHSLEEGQDVFRRFRNDRFSSDAERAALQGAFYYLTVLEADAIALESTSAPSYGLTQEEVLAAKEMVDALYEAALGEPMIPTGTGEARADVQNMPTYADLIAPDATGVEYRLAHTIATAVFAWHRFPVPLDPQTGEGLDGFDPPYVVRRQNDAIRQRFLGLFRAATDYARAAGYANLAFDSVDEVEAVFFGAGG